MTITARVLLDSLAPSGARLTTFEVKYPRFIHSEFMTHRILSRNAGSSRAIPVKKTLAAIRDEPALPVYWGLNRSGMQAAEELPRDEASRRTIDTGAPGVRLSLSPYEYAYNRWHEARDMMLRVAEELSDLGTVHPDWAGLGLHKQLSNRILEPWAHITVIVSGTCWRNFFHLRTHKDAQPEFQALAKAMKETYDGSTPRSLQAGDWHMPLVFDEDRQHAAKLLSDEMGTHYWASSPGRISELIDEALRKVSVGRCARVSYLTHDGRRDLKEDIDLHDRLLSAGHMSPFEHIARAENTTIESGNLRGFTQYRKTIIGEEDILGHREEEDA